jgi:heme/copper-type cytochrome/quinol oxidase subunit 3
MAETSAPVPAMSPAEEESAFHHEAALNAAWTGSRLAIGGLTFLFGAFVFAFFYLRSINSHHLWYPPNFAGPKMWTGVVIMGLIVVSAAAQTLVLQRIKAGAKSAWVSGAIVALVLGLVAVALQIWQLTNVPYWPGSSGFASVFVGSTPCS